MTILQEILEVKKEEIKKLKKKYTLSSYTDFEFFSKKNISFYSALSGKNKLNLIAEIKKASPSKGILKEDFNHIKIAETYFENNVDAISVLTDEKFFQGSISYLNDIAKIKNAPLLRKDFIIDEHQILEAKAFGADAVLLIAEALSKSQIADLTNCAIENRMDVLLEIHSAQQLIKIDFSLNNIIGINNRNLDTFIVDLNTTFELKKFLPEKIITISESGISDEQNIKNLRTKNINGVLVGGHFMKSMSLNDSVKEFISWCRNEN